MSSDRFDPEFFELVVREVLRRLAELGVQLPAGQTSRQQELVLSERLVTRATLEGRLEGVGRVVVGPRTVVTPAVRDELRDHQVELVRR